MTAAPETPVEPVRAAVRAALATLAAAAALMICAASAAASWAPAQNVTTGSPLFGEPLLFAGPAGELLSWSYSTAAPHQTEGAGEAVAAAGMRFGARRPLPHGYNGRSPSPWPTPAVRSD